ncbi:MAG: hypothetical protein M1457_08110 [bacterium]|nr:hypothetical protein [bacterium]
MYTIYRMVLILFVLMLTLAAAEGGAPVAPPAESVVVPRFAVTLTRENNMPSSLLLQIRQNGELDSVESVADLLIWWTTPSGLRRAMIIKPVARGIWANGIDPGPETGLHSVRIFAIIESLDRPVSRVIDESYTVELPQLSVLHGDETIVFTSNTSGDQLRPPRGAKTESDKKMGYGAIVVQIAFGALLIMLIGLGGFVFITRLPLRRRVGGVFAAMGPRPVELPRLSAQNSLAQDVPGSVGDSAAEIENAGPAPAEKAKDFNEEADLSNQADVTEAAHSQNETDSESSSDLNVSQNLPESGADGEVPGDEEEDAPAAAAAAEPDAAPKASIDARDNDDRRFDPNDLSF